MATPTPHNYSSFSYKVTDPIIQDILEARSRVDNVVQIGMPFVKVTSTVEVPELLGSGNYGFTLGIHGLLDAGYESIYAKRSEAPMVGHTYNSDGQNEPVYAEVLTNDQTIKNYFTQKYTLQDTTNSFNKIPPPGVTSLKIGTNRSGLSQTAEIQISVPSLQQLEFLNRVFLIPGCGMVVEWGQQFAIERNASKGERGLIGDIQDKMFPWYRTKELGPLLERLGKRQVGLEEILEDYVHKTDGQYMWMFGRIANIGTKGNADGSFDVTVKVVGPAEDQWAYSVRQTAMSSSPDENNICPDDGNSVESFLTNTTAGAFNLKTLLDGVADLEKNAGNDDLVGWLGHVISIPNGNKKEGTEGEQSDGNTNQSSFADVDNAYFMTWRFFVNVVLNHDAYGIRAIFKNANLAPETVEKIGLIRPYSILEGSKDLNVSGPTYINDRYENYVGNNKHLRSHDPGTVIIVNEYAAQEALDLFSTGAKGIIFDSSAEELAEKASDVEIAQKFLNKGDFLLSAGEDAATADKGFLSAGVWLNHKAVISSLLSGNTIMQGLSNLLGRMNNATRGYWSLTLDVSEPIGSEDRMDYAVVDQNYKGSSATAVSEAAEKIYTFNKFLRDSNKGVVGSELIDFNVNLDLPKLLFSQIATMGLSQAGDVEAADATSTVLQPCKTPTVSDANDTLRRMIGVSTISPAKGGVSIDITNRNTPPVPGECGSPSSGNAPAGTAGQGVQPIKPGPDESTEAQRYIDAQTEASDYLNDPINQCGKCSPCYETQQPPSTTVVSSGGTVQVTSTSNITDYCSTLSGDEKRFCQFAIQAGITDGIELAQLLGQFKHESGLRPIEETLKYGADFLYKNFAYEYTDKKTGQKKIRSWGFKSAEEAKSLCCGKNREGLANRIYGTRMGNSAPGDGFKYRGRGMVQLTGKDGYKNAGSAIGVDLINNPDLLLQFDTAAKASMWFWKTSVRPAVSRNRTTYQDTTVVTKAINGGTIGIDDRIKNFASFLQKFGFTASRGGQASTPAATRPPAPAPSTSSACSDELKRSCSKCIEQNDKFKTSGKAAQETRAFDNALASVTRGFPNLNVILRYIEVLPDRMVALIRCSANGDKANAFGGSPTSLSIKAEMTLPGIAGLRVGELFWIDRIQAIYKIFGAFQVMSIEQSIGMEGWQTKISAQFNNLGNNWKNKMINDLKNKGLEVSKY